MRRLTINPPIFPRRRTLSLRSHNSNPKYQKSHPNLQQPNPKLPLIINQIQHSLHLLKTFCQQQLLSNKITRKQPSFRSAPRPNSSLFQNKSKIRDKHEQTNGTIVPQLNDLKKSFISTYGYNSNNVIQLYNFYIKNCDKSTKLFASTTLSLSNIASTTQNHSQIRDKPSITNQIPPTNNLQKQHNFQIHINSQHNKLPSINTINDDKIYEMITNLLAEKKRIQRQNCIDNSNSSNVFYQEKRKLSKPSPKNDNIDKLTKIKQILTNENIKTISNTKIKQIKQRSISNKDHTNKHSNQIKFISSLPIHEFGCQPTEKIKGEQRYSSFGWKNIQQYQIEQDNNGIPAFQDIDSIQNKQNCSLNYNQPKNLQQPTITQTTITPLKPIPTKTQKTPAISPPQISTPPPTIPPKKQSQNPPNFLPQLHTHTNDSLLNCSITPKSQSKIVDLEAIPFDF